MTGTVRRLFTDDELTALSDYFESPRGEKLPRAEAKKVVRLVAELRQARGEIKRVYEEKARLLQRLLDAQAALREDTKG